MNKTRNGKIIKIFLLILAMVSINPVDAQDSFVILGSTDVQGMLESIRYIEDNGGRITHRFPPNILIGDIPENKNLIGHNIEKIVADKIDETSIDRYGKTAKIAANVWNRNFGIKDSISDINISEIKQVKPIIGDMLTVPEDLKTRKDITGKESVEGRPYGAGFYDTSEYMIGDIAVGIVFLESNGVIDPNTEDWSSSEEANVVNEIYNGLNWWVIRDPRAKLSFTYNIRYRVPTKYEPITRPYLDQSLWITDATNYLGFNSYSSYFDNVYDFNNYLRNNLNTDWAYTIFAVDSTNDLDNQFSNGYFAYAYLGGPFTVMTYENDGYGIDYMDAVIAHETGHIFYALDQYYAASQPCYYTSGYLNMPNQNSEYGSCLSNVPSIMRGQIYPFAIGAIDQYASGQIGWKDSDGDNVFDIIDFYPQSTLNAYSPDPTTDNTPTYTGISKSDSVYPNSNVYGMGSEITVNKIKNVQYRTDSGTWRNANPSSGSFDSSIENFIFTIPELSSGTHKIEVRSYNYPAGRWETAYASDSLTISGGTSITVVSPNGGEYWVRGRTYPIKWAKTGNPGAYVKIELLKSGVVNRVITSSTLNNGIYNWTIPSTQTEGSDFKVRITSTSNSIYTDRSNYNFQISAQINLLKNSGFESSDGIEPTYWDKYQTGTKAIFTYPEIGRTGTGKSVAIKYNTREVGKVGIWWQKGISVVGSRQYKLSGYMKLSNVVGSGATPRPGGAGLRVSWFRSDGSLIKTDVINKVGTIGWSRHEKIFTAPSNAVKATVGGDLFDSSGKVWFDDLSFIRIS